MEPDFSVEPKRFRMALTSGLYCSNGIDDLSSDVTNDSHQDRMITTSSVENSLRQVDMEFPATNEYILDSIGPEETNGASVPRPGSAEWGRFKAVDQARIDAIYEATNRYYRSLSLHNKNDIANLFAVGQEAVRPRVQRRKGAAKQVSFLLSPSHTDHTDKEGNCKENNAGFSGSHTSGMASAPNDTAVTERTIISKRSRVADVSPIAAKKQKR